MGKYRKKPVEIEAFKFYVDPMPDWFTDRVVTNEIILRNCNYNRYDIDEAYCEINTLEGVMIGKGGDYIIKGIQGEIYPCKPDIFEQTYDVVKDVSLSVVGVERYVKLKHVQELLKLIKQRDSWEWWSDNYDTCDKKVKNTVEWLERNAKEM